MPKGLWLVNPKFNFCVMKGFLNEVSTTQKGERYIVTSSDCYPCDEMDGWEVTNFLGIKLMPEDYSNDEVVVTENRLFLGGYEVMDYSTDVERWSSLSNQIPRYYVIRKYDKDRGYNSFRGGFDLLDDGRAWEGIKRTEYNTISDALRFVREMVGDDFSIWLEEPMSL
jgi:hypothetical protein